MASFIAAVVIFGGSLIMIPVGYKCIYVPISKSYSLQNEPEYHSILNTEESNDVVQEDATQSDSWMKQGGGYVEMGDKTENSLSERLKKLPIEKEEKIDIMKFVNNEITNESQNEKLPSLFPTEEEPFGKKFQERLKEEKSFSSREPLLEGQEETVINMRSNEQFYLPPKI
jgi:hypothetical protein